MTDRALLLDALLADPGKAAELSLEERQRLAAQLAAVQIALLAAPPPQPVTIAGETWIEAHEAAKLTSCSVRWVFTMSKREDWEAFTRRPSKKALLVERGGLLDWIARQTRLKRKRRHRTNGG